MGQEILYCYKCQTRLLGSEFEKGKAFKVGGKAACPVCVKDLLASMPEAKTDTPPKISTSGRILLPNPDSSSKFKAATVRATAPAPDSSKNTLIVAAVVGAVVILILIAMAMGSGRTPVTRNDPLPNEAPPPPIVRPDPPPPPAPAPSFSAELREINDKVRAFLDREEFRPAAEFLGVARRRHPETEWTAAIDEQTPQVEARARRAALAIRDKSLEAKKRGDDAEVKRLRDLVTAWGFPSALAELDKPVAEPEPPPPPAPAPAAGPLPGVFGDALGAGWLNHSWDSTVDFASTDAPFEGSRAIAFTPKKKYAGLFLGYVKPFDSRQYPFVSFAIRPAEDNLYVAAT
ncbi:MAG: hypothetical protein HY293_22450, partial [Planctomycetes bacterium]|nr:hypothetical protein [Planctomycetota bacterium]